MSVRVVRICDYCHAETRVNPPGPPWCAATAPTNLTFDFCSAEHRAQWENEKWPAIADRLVAAHERAIPRRSPWWHRWAWWVA